MSGHTLHPQQVIANSASDQPLLQTTALSNADSLENETLRNPLIPKHRTKRVDDPDSITQHGKTPEPEKHGIGHLLVDQWDNITDVVRDYSPAHIVNHGTKIVFGMRAIADAMSVYSGLQYSSKPRAAASLISLSGLGLGLMYTEDPVDAKERESYRTMGFAEYIPLKLRHALDPQHHVTATVGLATIPNGLLMAVSGYRQHVPGKVPWELIQGVMTIAAGSAMNFIPDQERAMQTAAAIFSIRAPFAYKQAIQAWKVGVPAKGIPAGDWGQIGKFGFNQASNMAGFFYAGVEKMPDGRILSIEEADAIHDLEAKRARGELPDDEKTLLDPTKDYGSGTATIEAPTPKVQADQISTTRVAEAPAPNKSAL